MTKPNFDPLSWNQVIVQPNGTATPEFLRQFNAARQFNSNLAALLAIEFIAGDGLSGGGTLGDLDDIGFALDQEFVRDLIGAMFVDSSNVDFTFNDSADQITADLTDTGVTAGTYGDASNIPQITVDAKGRITDIEEVPASGGGGGGNGWTLAGSWSHSVSGDTASPIDFTGLSGYEELLIVVKAITKSLNTTLLMRFSTNNGSSFFNTSGDYVDIQSSGNTVNNTAVGVQLTSTSTARSTTCLVTKLASEPVATPLSGSARAASENTQFRNNANRVDAIRLLFGAAGNFTGGVIEVWGR